MMTMTTMTRMNEEWQRDRIPLPGIMQKLTETRMFRFMFQLMRDGAFKNVVDDEGPAAVAGLFFRERILELIFTSAFRKKEKLTDVKNVVIASTGEIMFSDFTLSHGSLFRGEWDCGDPSLWLGELQSCFESSDFHWDYAKHSPFWEGKVRARGLFCEDIMESYCNHLLPEAPDPGEQEDSEDWLQEHFEETWEIFRSSLPKEAFRERAMAFLKDLGVTDELYYLEGLLEEGGSDRIAYLVQVLWDNGTNDWSYDFSDLEGYYAPDVSANSPFREQADLILSGLTDEYASLSEFSGGSTRFCYFFGFDPEQAEYGGHFEMTAAFCPLDNLIRMFLYDCVLYDDTVFSGGEVTKEMAEFYHNVIGFEQDTAFPPDYRKIRQESDLSSQILEQYNDYRKAFELVQDPLDAPAMEQIQKLHSRYLESVKKLELLRQGAVDSCNPAESVVGYN